MKAIIATASAVVALIVAIAGGVHGADSRYVLVKEFSLYAVEDFYDKYYAAEDRYHDAEANGDEDAMRTAKRTMERLRAKICAIDPEWERCDD